MKKACEEAKVDFCQVVENKRIKKADYNTLIVSNEDRLKDRHAQARNVENATAEKLNSISSCLQSNTRRNVMTTFLESNKCTFNEVLTAIDLYADSKYYHFGN